MEASKQPSPSITSKSLRPEDVEYALSILSSKQEAQPRLLELLLNVAAFVFIGVFASSLVAGLVTIWFDGQVGKTFLWLAAAGFIGSGVVGLLNSKIADIDESDLLDWRKSQVGKAAEEAWQQRNQRKWILGCVLLPTAILSLAGCGWFTYLLATDDTVFWPGLILMYLPPLAIIAFMGYAQFRENRFYLRVYNLRERLQSLQQPGSAGQPETVSAEEYQLLSHVERNKIKQASQQVAQELTEREYYGIVFDPEVMQQLQDQPEFLDIARLTSSLQVDPHPEKALPVEGSAASYTIQQGDYEVTYHLDEAQKRVRITSAIRREGGGNDGS